MSTTISNALAVDEELDEQLLDLMFGKRLFGMETPPEIGAQMWACAGCEKERQWGFFLPEDVLLRPVLVCRACAAWTRHTFRRVLKTTR
jgi:hypothetical protein